MASWCLRGALCLAAAWTAGAPADDLALRRASFEDALGKISREHKSRLEAAPKAYLAALDALAASRQKAGDLEALLQVKEEQERFRRDGTVPSDSPADMAPDLQALQVKHRESVQKTNEERVQRTLALVAQYTKQLDAQVTRLTRAGDVQGALACRAEAERVQTLPEVATAEFERAAGGAGGAADDPEAAAPPPAGERGACPACKGTGKGQAACSACNGLGLCGMCEGDGKRMGLGTETIMCVACRGSGKCKGCKGTGRTTASGPCDVCKGHGSVVKP